MSDELVIPGSTLASGRCALCWERFQIGDEYTTVWPKRVQLAVRLSLVVHRACFEQLDDGDLGRIFAALERRLALPLAVINGRRVEVRRA